MANLTTDQIFIEKEDLEDNISTLLKKFSEFTDLSVLSIDVYPLTYTKITTIEKFTKATEYRVKVTAGVK